MLTLILYVVALVLFVVAAFGVALPRVAFGWLGCAFFTAAVLFGGLPALT
jgi:hypothetical protein